MSANYRPIKFNLRSGDIKLTMNTLDLGGGGGGGSSSPVVARGSFVISTGVPSITPITPNVNIANTSIVSMGFYLEFVVELSQSVSNAAQVFVSCGAMPPSNILRDAEAALDNSTTPGTSYVRGRLYPGVPEDVNLYILVTDTTVGAISATTNGAVVARGTYDTAQTTGVSTPRLPMMNVVGCTDLGVLPQASPPFPAWAASAYYESWTYHVELAIRLSDSATAMLYTQVPAGAGVGSWIFIDNTTSPTVSYLDIQMGTSPALPGTYHFGFSFIVTDVGSV